MKGLKENLEDIESNKQAGRDLLNDLGLSAPVESCILVIEDDHIVLEFLRQVVTKSGYKLRCYQDPLEAIKDGEEFRVELLLLDMKLPNMNGLECLTKLRKAQGNPDFPVIVITGYTQKEMITEIVKYNITAIIAKPINKERLTGYLSKYAGKAKV